MTSEEIKNMSFEDFRTQIEGMEEVQKLTADGTGDMVYISMMYAM